MTDALQPLSRALALVGQARLALAEATTLPEVRTVKEWAGLAADAARRTKKLSRPQKADTRSLEQAQAMHQQAIAAELDAGELRIEAIRREGDLLRQMGMDGDRLRGRPGKVYEARKLSELGYERLADAAEAMHVAAIPEKLWRDYLQIQRERVEPPSVAGLISYAADAGKRLQAETIALPAGVFKTIVIDPPWPMAKLPRDDYPEQGARLDYPVMTLDEIRELPIAARATEGTHLYLWTTQRFLPDALTCVEAWGFRYHCLITWVKPSGFTPFSFMFNSEHAIFAYRPPFAIAREGLKIAFQHEVGIHSEKPEAFYVLAEMASFEPRLELFARRRREGWAAWGDEV